MEHYDILIIGGGAAGIAAAKAARDKKVLLADRKDRPGGILLQCAHPGFGKDMTGPEYARKLLEDFPETVELALRTTVTKLRENSALLCGPGGCRKVCFDRAILATGCREVPLGALPIAGTRPEGVYTAGQMQELVNMDGFLPEGPAVILGSGDIGLVMAWELARRGLEVTLVEQKETLTGLKRNQHRLQGYNICFERGTTITELRGSPRLEAVVLENGKVLPCACLLLAVGLRPEQTLCRGAGSQLLLCGNCASIHPMVEGVTQDGDRAGRTAAGL
jgi:NADPH-dependent 2,4-dienoyl-CoA reductase/sulfur reductase-like enzyme